MIVNKKCNCSRGVCRTAAQSAGSSSCFFWRAIIAGFRFYWIPRTSRGTTMLLAVFFVVLPLSNVYAADVISFIDILKNLKLSSDSVFKLTTAISYALGFWFMISALMDLKHYGQAGSAQNSSVSGPLIKFFVGVALIYLPSTMSSVIATFWGEGSVMAYKTNSSDILETFKITAIAIVQLIGLIAFINGFVVLAHSSEQNAQPGTVAKGIFRIFSGMLAINIVATIKILEATFGITIL